MLFCLSERLGLLKARSMHIVLKRRLSKAYRVYKAESSNIDNSKARGEKAHHFRQAVND